MFNRKKFADAWLSGKSKLKANCVRTDLGVILYSTRIVEPVLPNDYSAGVRLYTGGFHTMTTVNHINAMLMAIGIEYRVRIRKGELLVQSPAGSLYPFTEGTRVGKDA